MPREAFGPGYEFLHRSDLLSFEEITRLAGMFAGLGMQKIRLTGGEPLLRRDLEKLVEQLRGAVPAVELTLTTNGSLLGQKAASLKAAGLDRITVSLDALDETTFQKMNDANFPAGKVVEGIEVALDAGFRPVKINTVVRRGVNEHAIVELAERFAGPEYVLRFIEYMDVGNTNGWRMEEVVSAGQIIAKLQSMGSRLTPLEPHYPGEVARRYRTAAGGEIGIISSVTQPFCQHCHRARLGSDGRLYTCLFGTSGLDLRAPLRTGATNAELAALVRGTWAAREDRYSEERTAAGASRVKVEMSAIGG